MAAEQNVVDRLAALPGRLDHEAESALDALLADELVVRKIAGTEGTVQRLVAGGGFDGNHALGHAGRPRDPRSRKAAAMRASTVIDSPMV